MIVVFGEILFDSIGKEKKLGGAPFNYATHLHHFGCPATFVSRIGEDKNGREIINHLKLSGLPATQLQRDPEHPTGRVEVDLTNPQAPHYDIKMGAAYDYIEFTPALTELAKQEIDLIYFGTLIQRSPGSRATLYQLLDSVADKKTKKICDINLRPGCYTAETVKQSLHYCDILKISSEEVELLKTLETSTLSNEEFIQKLAADYNLNIICLTRGAAGSAIYAGGDYYETTAHEITVVDPVGAGDAYAALFTYGLLSNWEPGTILEQATLFSEAICSERGAHPADLSLYTQFTRKL